MRNYVISLASAKERREHIVKVFSEKGVAFNFFDAAFPGDQLNSNIANLVPSLLSSDRLTPGEKACYMSHVLLWHKCVEDNLPFICIFEDDIVLGKNAEVLLNHDAWLQERFNREEPLLVKIETFGQALKTVETNIQVLEEFTFDVLKSVHYGTAGYIINQCAARYLLAQVRNLSQHQVCPIDHLLFEVCLTQPKIRVYQLNPAICIQMDQINKSTTVFSLTSQLELERNINRQKILQKTQTNIFSRIVYYIKIIFHKVIKEKLHKYTKIPFNT